MTYATGTAPAGSAPPLAAHRVRQIIARYSPELAMHATHHSSELQLAASGDAEPAGAVPVA